MLTATLTPDFAAQLEQAEIHAWLDLYAAAPADFARQFQLEITRLGHSVLTRCPAIPFVHFNCVFNLGMGEPASEQQLDDVLDYYRAANVRAFAIYHNPLCQPASLPAWFAARQLRVQGGWERIYRDGTALVASPLTPNDGQVEEVTSATATAWADFIDAQYGLPTKPWLLALVGRPGWHHYLLRQAGRIVAVRTMYVHTDGMAWFGIDAPVPGVMAPSYALDAQLCQALVADGLTLGAKYFVADIEAPTAAMDTPAYHHFSELGFRRPYFRSHYGY